MTHHHTSPYRAARVLAGAISSLFIFVAAGPVTSQDMPTSRGEAPPRDRPVPDELNVPDVVVTNAPATNAPVTNAPVIMPAVSEAKKAVAPTVSPRPVPVPRGAPAVSSPGSGDEAAVPAEGEELLRLKFNNSPVDLVLEEYSQITGRTLLLDPGLPKVMITLQSQGDLTRTEYLQAIEAVLAMHGIALLRVEPKFLKVVPNKQARQEAMDIIEEGSEVPAVTSDQLVSQMIALKHIDIAEANKAIEALKHPYGQAQAYERINSVLVTDTAANLQKIIQVLSYLDQPVTVREEPNVVQIAHAKASDIKARLEEIVAEAQKDETSKPGVVAVPRDTGAPAMVRARIPGVIRAPQDAAPAPAASTTETIELAERGVIRGRVKIIADDRTNILIIITRPENMSFFEKIITVLDVETAPDVVVRVFRLEYASAKDIAGMLNDLIGAAATKDDATSKAKATAGEGAAAGAGEAKALDDYVAARRELATAAATARDASAKTKVGQLSKDNVKILSDERTNSLIIMASKSDLAAIEEIINDMDMMLSQVLVEAIILEINLDDSIETGVDWVQRAMLAYTDSAATRGPVVAFAGSGGGGKAAPVNPLNLDAASKFTSPMAGLSYYMTFFDLNIDAVLKAVASDSRTQILSSPVIVTTDNKDATIDVATERYFFKGKKYAGSADGDPVYEDDVERQKVGITLTVTPRINEKKFVVMSIKQTIDNVSGSQTINDTDWPVVTSRKLEAEIAVRSGDTIVLGGLVQNNDQKTRSKIPILGDIPLLGFPFRSSRKEKSRNEVIVFITPYVMDTPEQIMSDAIRRRDALQSKEMWKQGWSNSRLAEPATPKRSWGRRVEALEKADGGFSDSDTVRPREATTNQPADPVPTASDNTPSPEVQKFIHAQEAREKRAVEAGVR